MPRIWFISDTHGRHLRLQIPPDIDCVIHCGDESNKRIPGQNLREAEDFFSWFRFLPIPKKFFVPGNHSTAIEQGFLQLERYPEIEFLIHAPATWRGLSLFGSPFTPAFHDWAYMRSREELDAYWATIPTGLDILITHGPPRGIRDRCHDRLTSMPLNVGCQRLLFHSTQRIKPRIHAFGHIHDEPGAQNFGCTTQGSTQFLNCACVNLRGQVLHHGIVVEIETIQGT